MGIFGDIGKGLLGIQTSKTDTSFSNTASRQVDLREWKPEERAAVDRAYEGLLASGQDVDKQEIYDRMFGLSSRAIKDTFAASQARDYANQASRGAASTSAGNVREDRQAALQARETGDASDRAFLGTEDFALRARADQRATAEAYLRQLTAFWDRQLSTSKITTTSSGTGTSSSETGPTIGNSLAAGVGNYFGSSENETLSRIFGG